MFSKYWRNYPWFLQLILFVILTYVLYTFFALIALSILPKLTGYNLTDIIDVDEKSPSGKINASLIAQMVIHLGSFMIPAILFANLTHPRPFQYLGLRKPGKPVQWPLVVLVMLGAIPVMIWLENIFATVGLGGHTAKVLQEKNETLTGAYLNMPTFGSFLFAFLVMAIVPALGEEMLFRGVFMRLFHKGSMSMRLRKAQSGGFQVSTKNHIVFPLLLTSLIFAAVHFTVYGFVSIFIAGLLLGLIYYLTGSLWCSILAHLINNGLQIILIYMANGNATLQAAMKANTLPVYLPVSGALVCAGALYLLWKNSTPLRADWSVDFTAAELSDTIAQS
jgi:uncharacterized protein